MQRIPLLARLLAVLCAAALAGCIPGVNQPYPTFTPDTTLEAIPRMLTATSGAPTATPTVYHTPTPTPTSTPTPPRPGSAQLPGSLGERIQSGDVALLVLSTSQPEKIGALRRKEKTRYLDVEVIIENSGQASAEYNRMLFRLKGRAGTYEPMASAAGPVLLSGDLRPDEWVRGHVTFNIPEDERASSLLYHPDDPRNEVVVRIDEQAAETATVPATGAQELINGLPGPGERVEAGGLALQVEQVSAAKRIQWTRPEKGLIFVDLLITLSNEQYDTVPFNSGYFTIKDAQGYEYPSTIVPSEEMIQAGSLERGEQVQGHVVFAVPEGTQDLLLKYQPQVLTANYEEIRVGIPVPPAK